MKYTIKYKSVLTNHRINHHKLPWNPTKSHKIIILIKLMIVVKSINLGKS